MNAAEVTGIVSETVLVRPSAPVTRRCTRWFPAVANEVLTACPPAANTPLPLTSQANAVIGLVASVELDTSETGSPVCGVTGNHVKDAAGAAGVAPVPEPDEATPNVDVALTPRLPTSSDCLARTVYVPGLSPATVVDHAPPELLTVTLCASRGGAASSTVTSGRSPSA